MQPVVNSLMTPNMSRATSDQLAMTLTPELARHLMACGLMALERKRFAQARIIFLTLREFRPRRDYPLIGLALLALYENKKMSAVMILREGLKLLPGSVHLRMFLGMALLQNGQLSECATLLSDGERSIVTEPQRAMLRAVQEELRRHAGPASLQWRQMTKRINAMS